VKSKIFLLGAAILAMLVMFTPATTVQPTYVVLYWADMTAGTAYEWTITTLEGTNETGTVDHWTCWWAENETLTEGDTIEITWDTLPKTNYSFAITLDIDYTTTIEIGGVAASDFWNWFIIPRAASNTAWVMIVILFLNPGLNLSLDTSTQIQFPNMTPPAIEVCLIFQVIFHSQMKAISLVSG
jgi:hypothetical protein